MFGSSFFLTKHPDACGILRWKELILLNFRGEWFVHNERIYNLKTRLGAVRHLELFKEESRFEKWYLYNSSRWLKFKSPTNSAGLFSNKFLFILKIEKLYEFLIDHRMFFTARYLLPDWRTNVFKSCILIFSMKQNVSKRKLKNAGGIVPLYCVP